VAALASVVADDSGVQRQIPASFGKIPASFAAVVQRRIRSDEV
jgi:hypothetical protein